MPAGLLARQGADFRGRLLGKMIHPCPGVSGQWLEYLCFSASYIVIASPGPTAPPLEALREKESPCRVVREVDVGWAGAQDLADVISPC